MGDVVTCTVFRKQHFSTWSEHVRWPMHVLFTTAFVVPLPEPSVGPVTELPAAATTGTVTGKATLWLSEQGLTQHQLCVTCLDT
jgi:hypothetical protein